MYTFYNSVCRLLHSSKSSKSSKSSLDNISKSPLHNISKDSLYNNIMISPENTNSRIITENDAGERVILEYNKHDKTFAHYRPKYLKYK